MAAPEDRGPAPDREPVTDRGAEAAVHLQRAAIEFISAARTLLDVAEEAVREPAGLLEVVSETLSGLLAAIGSVQPPRDGQRAANRDGQAPGAARPGVEHIRIS